MASFNRDLRNETSEQNGCLPREAQMSVNSEYFGGS